MVDNKVMEHTAEQLTQELLAVLPLLNRIVAAEVRREAGEATTMPQFRVLDHLALEPMTLSALARQRRVSLQAMSELVQLLVERGWVGRTPDPRDRRQQLLQLTAQGQAHYERAQTQTMRRLAPLMDDLTDDERAAVARALPALHRVLTRDESEEPHDR